MTAVEGTSENPSGRVAQEDRAMRPRDGRQTFSRCSRRKTGDLGERQSGKRILWNLCDMDHFMDEAEQVLSRIDKNKSIPRYVVLKKKAWED